MDLPAGSKNESISLMRAIFNNVRNIIRRFQKGKRFERILKDVHGWKEVSAGGHVSWMTHWLGGAEVGHG
jgi:hypothetical protein